MNVAAMLGEVAGIAAEEALRAARMGEISSVGEAQDLIGAAMTKFMDQQGPAIAEKLAVYLEPATQKAVDIIKPSVMEALKEYTPTFAAVSGTMIALSVLAGTYLARREFRKARS